jgi:hypothetical protein
LCGRYKPTFQNNLPYLSPVVATAASETPVHLLDYVALHCTIYRAIQEDRSVFWLVISVIVRTKVYMNICKILNGYPDRAI